jgi:ubiquinone/menaquinone biosynthesis C-methylase UbiE
MLECLLEIVRPSRVFGVDISNEALAYVRDRYRREPRVEIRQGGFAKLPFADGSMDLVVSTEILEHLFLPDFFQAFSEVSRILRPGGYWIATIPIDEKLSMVVCPECRSVFTPFQHLILEISEKDLKIEIEKNGMKFMALYQAIDRRIHGNLFKKIVKSGIIAISPSIGAKLFPKPGTTGFLALKK